VPDWQPEWSDVVFDHAFAAAAADRCDAMAVRLAAIRSDLDRHAATAGVDWRGPARDDFERLRVRRRQHSQRLEVALRSWAAEARRASVTARAEQAARETTRQLWWQQTHAERVTLTGPARRAA
jgi:hypothetical protein